MSASCGGAPGAAAGGWQLGAAAAANSLPAVAACSKQLKAYFVADCSDDLSISCLSSWQPLRVPPLLAASLPGFPALFSPVHLFMFAPPSV